MSDLHFKISRQQLKRDSDVYWCFSPSIIRQDKRNAGLRDYRDKQAHANAVETHH